MLFPPLPKHIIPKDLVHDALNNPSVTWYGTGSIGQPIEDQFVKYTFPAEGGSQDPHDLDRQPLLHHLLERFQLLPQRRTETRRSSSCSRSIPGSRTIATSRISSFLSAPSSRKRTSTTTITTASSSW